MLFRAIKSIIIMAACAIAMSASMTAHAAFFTSGYADAPFPGLDWGSIPLDGTYSFAPGLTNYAVDGPNGATATYSDLATLRYHHHTRVAVGSNGRVWVAYSGGLDSEDGSGQITEVRSSTDNWTTSTAQTIVTPSQSTPDDSHHPDIRITYPRAFVKYNGDLYLVSAVDQKTSYGGNTDEIGLALLAVKCNPDGTIGSPFLISAETYTPLATFPSYTYDPTLGPPLFLQANLFGTWGGSCPFQAPSSWTGYTTNGGAVFVEPSTITVSQDGQRLYRLWRRVNGSPTNLMYYSFSANLGSTWSPVIATNLPNAPSETTILKLANGNIAVVGNNQGDGVWRDPLYLAIFDGKTGYIRSVNAVRQGLSGVPTYPNGQTGGAQYPGIWEDNGTLYISYSIAKQQIGMTTIPSNSL